MQKVLKKFLKKSPHSNISNYIFSNYVKNKGNVVLDTILDFADVSSYLTFKLSKTYMPQTSLKPVLENTS